MPRTVFAKYHDLQEIVGWSTSASRNMSHVIRDSREDAEFGIQVLVDCHDGCYISTAVAVVGCRPHRDNRVLRKVEFVAFVDKLMSSRDQFESVDVVELCGNLVSE